MKHAFSLIELLVALSILAVVAAVIVPKFMNIRDQAEKTMVQSNIAELERAYANWTAAGGHFTRPPANWDNCTPEAFIKLMSGDTSANLTGQQAIDGGLSSSIRLSEKLIVDNNQDSWDHTTAMGANPQIGAFYICDEGGSSEGWAWCFGEKVPGSSLRYYYYFIIDGNLNLVPDLNSSGVSNHQQM